MPELPEVETVRKYLDGSILNQKIKKVFLSNKKSLRNVSEKELNSIEGETFTSTDRIGKHLILYTDKHYLIMHLRMEGKFFVFNSKEEMENNTNRFHDVLIIETNKSFILFQDTRRFATIDLFKKDLNYSDNHILNKMGLEPFEIDAKDLYNRLVNKNVAIKSALLDQTIIAGLGNIYVDEVLFKSGLHPEKRTNTVTLDECKDIVKHSRSILKKAIELNGTTIRSYTSSLGVEGSYQNKLTVHQRKDEQCTICKTAIIKIKVGGRGTYLCPKCQKN